MSSSTKKRPPATVALVHLGCARNLIDSEVILARMAEQDLTITGDPSQADIAVLNTCSFIGPARDESHGAIEELLERKRNGDLSGVVVAGCLVQRYRKGLQERYPEVDLFAEISDYRQLAKRISDFSQGRRGPAYLEATERPGSEREGARLLSTPSSYAFLRISHGCDHTCGFCAIPSIRGKHRSKDLAGLLDEARELIACGVRELVLVAEDATAWGRDKGTDLCQLVEALADLEGDARVRIMYAYPNNFPWGLTRLLREHPKVYSYLDIPVQHSATNVLRAMGRAGSGDQVRRILGRLRDEVPGITLRTTLLLGYPGETDADFEDLLQFIEEYSLGRMGAFLYSHEEGTPAEKLKDDVPHTVKEERYRRLLEVRDGVLQEQQAELVGTELDVLIDEDSRFGPVGRTDWDAPEVDLLALVETPEAAERPAVGERVRVRVRELDDEYNLICTRELGAGEGGAR